MQAGFLNLLGLCRELEENALGLEESVAIPILFIGGSL
jgi:hypothetical protein